MRTEKEGGPFDRGVCVALAHLCLNIMPKAELGLTTLTSSFELFWGGGMTQQTTHMLKESFELWDRFQDQVGHFGTILLQTPCRTKAMLNIIATCPAVNPFMHRKFEKNWCMHFM